MTNTSSIDEHVFRRDIDSDRYINVRYFVRSDNSLKDAALAIAIGQSVGNPGIRNDWETRQLLHDHLCVVLNDPRELAETAVGHIDIAFPLKNIDLRSDGISQLLCHVMGGQLDIDSIDVCRVESFEFPDHVVRSFHRPKYGIDGIRKFTGAYERPILGGIIKPKVGMSPQSLLDQVKELVEGGVNFIKEDEIMSNPSCCTIEERVPLVMDYLSDKRVVYAVCVNSDAHVILDRVRRVHQLGGNAVHANVWSGIGTYRAIRELDLPMFLFFQKSGDRAFTDDNHRFGISWPAMCQLAALMGVDFIHAGMWGGYSSYPAPQLQNVLNILHSGNVLPSLSCGVHPGLVDAIVGQFGSDIMLNVGGAIHGHPGGTLAGARAMRDAIDGRRSEELDRALEIWGYIKA